MKISSKIGRQPEEEKIPDRICEEFSGNKCPGLFKSKQFFPGNGTGVIIFGSSIFITVDVSQLCGLQFLLFNRDFVKRDPGSKPHKTECPCNDESHLPAVYR
ncbi:hypothetical protein D3C86_1797510 [compost metagenome]